MTRSEDHLGSKVLHSCMPSVTTVMGLLAALLLDAGTSGTAVAVQPQSINPRMDTRHEASVEYSTYRDLRIDSSAYLEKVRYHFLDYSYTYYRALPEAWDLTLGAGVRGRAAHAIPRYDPLTAENGDSAEMDDVPAGRWFYVTGTCLVTSQRMQFLASQLFASYEYKPEHDEYRGTFDRYRGGLIMGIRREGIHAGGNWIATSSGPHQWRMVSADLFIGDPEDGLLGGRYEHHDRAGDKQSYIRRELYAGFFVSDTQMLNLAFGSYRFARNHEVGGRGWWFFRMALTF